MPGLPYYRTGSSSRALSIVTEAGKRTMSGENVEALKRIYADFTRADTR